jgi:hypothetical protein
MTNNVKKIVHGSRRPIPQGIKSLGKPKGDSISVAVQIKRKFGQSVINEIIRQIASGARPPLTEVELIDVNGAHPEYLAHFQSVAATNGLVNLPQSKADQANGIVRVQGDSTAIEQFFNVELDFVEHEATGERFRIARGHVSVPAECHDYVVGVHRLSKNPIAEPKHEIFTPFTKLGARAAKPSAATPAMTARGFAKLFGHPLMSSSKTAGYVISLGGDNGESIDQGLAAACAAESVPVPPLVRVPVNGAVADGDPADGATVENALDVQNQALTNPYRAIFLIVCNNTDDDFVSGQETAISLDPNALLQNPSQKITMIGGSVSWGGRADNFAAASLLRWKRAMDGARLRSMNCHFAAGDNGATDKPGPQKNAPTFKATRVKKADAPTARPAKYWPDAPGCVVGAINCGGFQVNSKDGKTIDSLVTWDDVARGGGAGGCGLGVDAATPDELALGALPADANTGKSGLHVNPTISGNAAPASGVVVYMSDGKGNITTGRVGGTSSSSPGDFARYADVREIVNIPDPVSFLYRHAGTACFLQVSKPCAIGPYKALPTDKINAAVGLGFMVTSAMIAAAHTEHVARVARFAH